MIADFVDSHGTAARDCCTAIAAIATATAMASAVAVVGVEMMMGVGAGVEESELRSRRAPGMAVLRAIA